MAKDLRDSPKFVLVMVNSLLLASLVLFALYYVLIELPSPVFVVHSSGRVSRGLSPPYRQALSSSRVPRPALVLTRRLRSQSKV